MKGISPIVSIVLIFLISAAMIGLSYAFIMDALFSRTAAPFSIVDSYDNKIVIRNIGDKEITEFTVFTVDGEDALIWVEGMESIYFEDFQDKIANGWVALSGDWSAESQSYMSDGRSETAESRLGLAFSDVMIKYDMKFGEVKVVDVIIVIDRSGSMSGEIDEAKTAANYFIDQLDSVNDRSAVVSYGDDATLDQELTFNQALSKAAVNAITTTGDTAMDKAIHEANIELINNGRSEAFKVQIMLNDGQNDCGEEPVPPDCQDRLNAAVQESIDNNLVIYTIGLGLSADEDNLKNISNVTGGKHFHSPSTDDLLSIYNEIASEILVPGNTSLILKNSDDEAVAGLTFSIDPDFIKVIDPQTSQVIESEITSFDFDVWYPVEISVSGKVISVMVNEYLLGGPTSKGDDWKSEISLVTENSAMFFDNFDVSESVIKPETSKMIRIMNNLTRGVYKIHVCTISMCATNYIRID
jgi:uncharacterized protein YegL